MWRSSSRRTVEELNIEKQGDVCSGLSMTCLSTLPLPQPVAASG